MFNRRLFVKLAAVLPGAAVASQVASPAAAASGKQKVAYHVSDRAKVAFCLNNIRNHIKGAGGIEKVEIVLVAHGPALKEFHAIDGNPSVMDRVTALMGEGVEFNACGNTMRVFKYEDSDLLDGMIRVDQGGVVRLAELQQQGYLYLRP